MNILASVIEAVSPVGAMLAGIPKLIKRKIEAVKHAPSASVLVGARVPSEPEVRDMTEQLTDVASTPSSPQCKPK